MSMPFSIRASHFFAVLCLLALTSVFAERASATSADPRLFGPWEVVDTPSKANIGLRVYFSPDGLFFMVDPKTQLGVTGTWSVGRAGLLVSVFGSGKWAKLWDAEVTFEGDQRMQLDVKNSEFVAPLRVVLQKMVLK